ncbi:MAG: rRNA pseudouridine synthase, partial [Myxococcales bacterium]
MSRDRLQKIVARAGLSSRRGAEELITSGRVRVNGRVVTELGTQADMRNDRIEVDGKRLVPELFVYVLLHKPRKVVSTRHDPEGRPTVTELVATVPVNLYPVGRLDFHTSGALLLTNDGEFTQGMLHPRQGVPKVYVAKVQGEMIENDLERWRQGIQLEDGMTAPCEATLLRYEGDKTWIEVTLHEGRNQQIRRMGEASGFPIMRLARLSFAGISTEGLRPGQFRLLESDELRDLKERYGVPKRVHKQQVAIDPTLANRRPARAGGFGDDEDDVPARRESRTRIDSRGTAHTDSRNDSHGGRSGARTTSRNNSRSAPRAGSRSDAPRGSRDDAPRG